MPITLKDIADRTGVSPSVVSTVLSGRDNGTFVSKDTRQRVIEVAQQLNYSPVRPGRPRGSRRLRRQHSEQFIGVWSPDADLSALATFAELQGVLEQMDEAHQGGSDDWISYGLRLVSDAELPRLDVLGLMGLVIIGDIPLSRHAAAATIPTIQLGEVDHPPREVSLVHLDNFAAGRSTARFLWDLGHRSLAFLAPGSKPRVTRQRWQGLHSIWVEEQAPASSCVPAPFDTKKQPSIRDQVDATVRSLFQTGQRPTALVCFNETVTSYALQSLHRLGIHVPDQVSVTTFGDSPGGAEACTPPVTTIKLPVSALVKAALDELITRSDETRVLVSAGAGDKQEPRSPGPSSVRSDAAHPGELVIRDSSGPPPV